MTIVCFDNQFENFTPGNRVALVSKSFSGCNFVSETELFVPKGYQSLLTTEISISNACLMDAAVLEISTEDSEALNNYVTVAPEYMNSEDSTCSAVNRFNSAFYSFGIFVVEEKALISIKVTFLPGRIYGSGGGPALMNSTLKPPKRFPLVQFFREATIRNRRQFVTGDNS